MKEYSDLQAQIKGEEAAFKITDVELKMMEPAVKMVCSLVIRALRNSKFGSKVLTIISTISTFGFCTA